MSTEFKITKSNLTSKMCTSLGNTFANSFNLLRMSNLVDFNMLESALARNLDFARDIVAIKEAVPVEGFMYCQCKARDFLNEFKDMEKKYNA